MIRGVPVDGRGWIKAGGLAATFVLCATGTSGQERSLAAEGQQVYRAQGCYGCHTMGKTGTPVAPDLSKIGSKYSEADLRAWLSDPKAQKPRAHMSKIDLSKTEIDALAAYLASLR